MLEWSRKWHEEQSRLLNQLYAAERADNHSQIMYITDQLRGLTEKMFPNLDRLFYNLTNASASKLVEPEPPRMILLTEYATTHNVSLSTCRDRIARGTLKTAVLRGRDWWIQQDEEFIDHRHYTPRHSQHEPDVSDDVERVKHTYVVCGSVKETADKEELSESKVVKLLSTGGIWVNPTAEKVSQLLSDGLSKEEVAKVLKKSVHALYKYFPYEKGTYKKIS